MKDIEARCPEPWWMALPEPDALTLNIMLVMVAMFDVWALWFVLHVQLGWL